MSTRKVFGRREAKVDDVSVVLELRADRLWLRRKRARAQLHLSFHRLWHLAKGQGELTFNVSYDENTKAMRARSERPDAARAQPKRARKKAAPAQLLAEPVAAVPAPNGAAL